MTKQTAWIITAVSGVIALCCALSFCGTGITMLTGYFQSGLNFALPSLVGILPICLSVIFIAIPVALWYFLVRGKNWEEGAEVPATIDEPPAS